MPKNPMDFSFLTPLYKLFLALFLKVWLFLWHQIYRHNWRIEESGLRHLGILIKMGGKMQTEEGLWVVIQEQRNLLVWKSRYKWFKEVDVNTIFFFRNMENSRKRKNQITKIQIDGRCIEDPDSIENSFQEFYKSLFASPLTLVAVWRLDWDSLPNGRAEWLERRLWRGDKGGYPWNGWWKSSRVRWVHNSLFQELLGCG